MSYHHNPRQVKVSVYDGEMPWCSPEEFSDCYVLDETDLAGKIHLPEAFSECPVVIARSALPTIMGEVGHEYPRDITKPAMAVISVPWGAGYWLDDKVLTIAKPYDICQYCGHLLVRENGVTACWGCEMIWEDK